MKCYLCGSKNYFNREGKVRDNPSIQILECEDCGLVFLDKQNTGDVFYEENNMLNENFFKFTKRDGESLEAKTREFYIHNALFVEKRFKLIKQLLVGKKLLDFGSGRAQFLLKAREIANEVAGVEIETRVQQFYEENNIPLFRSLDEIKESGGGGYDLITAFHVIEHLQDPITILKQLASLLKENGKMIIEVPNANDALLTIYKNKAFSEFTYWSPHLYLYNPHTLQKLGEKAGLKVDFVKCIQRYPLSNTLYWLSNGLPAGQKIWGGFLDSKVLQEAYESALASVGATDTLIAQFSKI
ncbi:class I SAM-dependent methyltransferase [Helicobacter sp.]|uniref:class I SAM-dependent methyltransferase n=1 Tax=Helicobacter sp. TaxID=218 RepID=UPI0025849C46|nr:class I SAM-dependent methyltransferase [Helicobacter sp.]MCI7046828.1 class I SAM-dependent methyltransferase [Helicobacter sp.]